MPLFSVTVPASTAFIEYRDGVAERVLPSGRHPRRAGATYSSVDLREQLHQVASQEVPVQDGITVRVSAAVRWKVAEPVAYVEQSVNPLGVIHLATQMALREALAGLSVAELATRGAGVLSAPLTPAVAEVGMTVGIAVLEVVVKDVIVPGEVRSAAMELVTARSRGLAQLEAARAETAALRSLANGAVLLDKHPALAQLRLVQALPHGSRVVLAIGEDATGSAATAE